MCIKLLFISSYIIVYILQIKCVQLARDWPYFGTHQYQKNIPRELHRVNAIFNCGIITKGYPKLNFFV